MNDTPDAMPSDKKPGSPKAPDLSRDRDHDGDVDAADDVSNDLDHDGDIDLADREENDIDNDRDIDATDLALENAGGDATSQTVGEALGMKKEQGAWKAPDSITQQKQSQSQGQKGPS